VALVGNPKVGKSSTFNMLTGKYAEVSNYPGTSVAVAWSKMDFGILIDTPGIYDLSEQTKIAEITRKHIDNADIVLNVVSALTIERDLKLTHQLLETGRRVVLVINQVDEAERRGKSLDYTELEQLGVKIIKTVATKGIGRAELLAEINGSDNAVCGISLHAQELLHGKPGRSAKMASAVSQKLDRFLLHPVFGWLAVAFVLYALFVSLGVFISGTVVDWLVELMQQHYIPFVSTGIRSIFGNGLITDMLAGEFGVLTMVVQVIIGILLPLIVGFYVIMSFLEDSGYIPRMAMLTKRFFNFIGLNGDAIIPVLLGLGCGVMGTISTRILSTRKERIIATSIIAIAIPCAAQQGLIFSMLARINDFMFWAAYIAVVLLVIAVSGRILRHFMPGTFSKFSMELPPMRVPSLKNCYRKTFYRVRDFLFESFPVFSISSLFITVLYKYRALDWLQGKLAFVVENWLHLPKAFSDVFVMGIIRRDMASLEVLNMSHNFSMSNTQIFTSVIVISLFVPCINAIIVISKELGWRLAAALWGGTFVLSVALGGIITRVCEMMG
ncbi:MAG: ferrous iron transporter B, partial [Alphaproteobacteria bacterium]|nr:ferrous iron transporter B [Alphaproteobacteria bacterium]